MLEAELEVKVQGVEKVAREQQLRRMKMLVRACCADRNVRTIVSKSPIESTTRVPFEMLFTCNEAKSVVALNFEVV